MRQIAGTTIAAAIPIDGFFGAGENDGVGTGAAIAGEG